MVDIFNGRVPGWAGVASGQCTPGYTLVPATPAPRLFSAHPGAGAKNRAPTGLLEQPLVFQRSSLRSFLFSGLPKRKAAPRSASCSPVLLSFGASGEPSGAGAIFRAPTGLSARRYVFMSFCLKNSPVFLSKIRHYALKKSPFPGWGRGVSKILSFICWL